MLVLKNRELHSFVALRKAWESGKVFLCGDKAYTKHNVPPGTIKLVGRTKESAEILSRTGKVKPRIFFDPPHDISITLTYTKPATEPKPRKPRQSVR